MPGVNVMTGVNLQATFIDTFGNTLSTDDLGRLISVTWQSKSQVLTSQPVDNGGQDELYRQPGSYTADFEFDRNQSTLWDLIAAMDQDYYDGNQQRLWDVYVTVINPDGSTSQMHFARGVFSNENSGPWSKTALVKEKFTMEFSRYFSNGGASILGPGNGPFAVA